MDLYCKEENFELYHGDMRDIPEVLGKNSVDAIVTDPPYELNFMNKSWDRNGISFQKETWEKCFDVLKPGGHMLVFGGTRTFHRIACAIEDAGFEIRDCIQWIFSSGFPKSLNVGLAVDNFLGVESAVVGVDFNGSGAQPNKLNNHSFGDTGIGYADGSGKIFKRKCALNEWNGYGTQLKPAYEPILLVRKPLDGTVAENVLKWGVGGLNIDDCRISHSEVLKTANRSPKSGAVFNNITSGYFSDDNILASADPKGRFPANVILSYDNSDYDEVCGGFPDSEGARSQNNYSNGSIYRGQSFNESSTQLSGYREWYNDFGSASRYFYCAKASKKDREEGLYFLEDGIGGGMSGTRDQSLKTGSGNERNNIRKNTHPTVKPTLLMEYLICLITPKGGIVLDPFNGSGSTGKAAMWENKERGVGYFYIGVDLNEKYLEISKARIEYAIDADKIEEEIYEKTRSEIRPGEVLDMFGSD